MIAYFNPDVHNHPNCPDAFAFINRLNIPDRSNNPEFPRVCCCHLAEYITNYRNEAAQYIVYSGILNPVVSHIGSSNQPDNGRYLPRYQKCRIWYTVINSSFIRYIRTLNTACLRGVQVPHFDSLAAWIAIGARSEPVTRFAHAAIARH